VPSGHQHLDPDDDETQRPVDRATSARGHDQPSRRPTAMPHPTSCPTRSTTQGEPQARIQQAERSKQQQQDRQRKYLQYRPLVRHRRQDDRQVVSVMESSGEDLGVHVCEPRPAALQPSRQEWSRRHLRAPAAITAMATKVPEIAAPGLTDSRAHMRDRNLLA
jgi:hypothetical protein